SIAAHVVLGLAHVRSDALIELARMATLLLAGALAYDLLAHEFWRDRITDAIVASAVVVAALALLQYAGWASYLFPVFPTYTQAMYSVFGNQDLLGGYMAIAVPLALARFIHRPRVIWAAATLAMVVTLVVSGCRSAWLAAA